ncbi:putative glycosyltransferase [Dorcoceras hygrometricum]|uniref:Putative glycosyltransferase n=1 Tax=Dorcoceras hygrometricum TaxID=472368 RepID=A0A2Z7BCJ2_9LAMI|nr:putative glycosyltransferase [Dorcoceras hygrometricum]
MQRLPAATYTIKTTTYVSHATVTIYIKFHQLQATVPLTRVDYQNLLRLIQYLEKFDNSNSCPSAIIARWFSDTTDQSVTTPMIALYLLGMTHLYAGHNVALSQISPGHGNLSLLKLAALLVTPNSAGTSLELKSVKEISYLSSQLHFSSLIPTVRTHILFYLAKQLLTARTKLKTARNTYPEAHTVSRKLYSTVARTYELLLRVPSSTSTQAPNWYQSKVLLKTSSAPPVSLQKTAEIDGNLPKKGSNEQYLSRVYWRKR